MFSRYYFLGFVVLCTTWGGINKQYYIKVDMKIKARNFKGAEQKGPWVL